MATEIYLTGKELSDEYPYYDKVYEQILKIHRYKRYFVKRYVSNGFSAQRYFELKFLPYGENLGYDNHPWRIIQDIEEILNSLNEVAFQQK